ncbi:hypothetical protein JQ599_22505 [Bradyrhizobium diazoefficiens]|nr:hypothetical protein [Bradyrhizobium diazoefficiens]MBR0702694.1 hypothetical protein [Bradyrhizobium diazoefficiens]MBR0771449.1 hypothetical protein [Bradyrhizobium diazoefficiens]
MSTETRTSRTYGFCLLAAIGRRSRIRSWILAILLALMPALLPTAPAQAGCNLEDMVDAFKQAVTTTADCEPVCENTYECYAVAVLAAALTFDAKQGVDVSPICVDAPAKVEDLMAKLTPFLSQQDMVDLSQYTSYISDALAFVKCACETKDLHIDNESSFGVCVDKAASAIGCAPIVIAGFTITYDCAPGHPLAQALDAAESWACKHLDFGCDEDDYVEANYHVCPSGQQSDRSGNCVPCESIANAVTGNNGECACKSGYSENAFWLYIGQTTSKFKILQSCNFSCNAPFVYTGGFCQCPFGSQSDYGGGCTPCSNTQKYVPFTVVGGVFHEGRCEPCPLGTRLGADRLSCVSLCDNPNEIMDMATKKCVLCPPGQKTVHDLGTYGHCEACAYGQKVSTDHKSCVPACAPGQIMGGLMLGKDQAADPGAYQCQTCPDNTYASYEAAGSSKGICLPCADGTSAKAGATKCLALSCGPGSYPDPNDPHACKSCPPTQIYIPAEKSIVTNPATGQTSAQVVAGHCGCGDNQVLQGGACVCAKGATKINLPQFGGSLFACACPAGAHFDAATSTCVCAVGANIDAAKNACLCPTGQHLDGDKCVSASLSGAPLVTAPKDCSTLGPNYINNPKTPAACLRCPTGRIANADRDACLPLGRPAAPVVVLPPAGQAVRPVLQCPPGMAPNATGRACIRRPGLQRVAPPPALARPPIDRPMPKQLPKVVPPRRPAQ